ncbi:MAG: diaminopimelate decarboxylase [Fimbriimonadales bacterium]
MSVRTLGSQSVINGKLHFAGISAEELVAKYGTPLYVLDATDIRDKVRSFKSAATAAHPHCTISYASKANSTLALLELMKEEDLDLDVASEGELEAGLRAGFSTSRIHLHGNNKSDREIDLAVHHRLQAVVLDNLSDISRTAAACKSHETTQGVFLRLAPGVDPDTHKAISTGQEDTKFGMNISDGSAAHAVEMIASHSSLRFLGYHIHVGSQLMNSESVAAGAERASEFAIEMQSKIGLPQEMNCGGGLGVRYLPEQITESTQEFCAKVIAACHRPFQRAGLQLPRIGFEPGRFFVAESGTTLYKVGPIKTVPIGAKGQTRRYLSVDGGLADNPRPQLYGALYYAMNASRCDEQHDHPYRISGRHCETDMLIPEVDLPAFTKEGDILAVQCTGAYNAAMASNYNRYPRPATVIVGDGEPFVAVERESIEELFRKERTKQGCMTQR